MNPSEEKEEQLFDKMFNTPGHYDLIGDKKQLTKEQVKVKALGKVGSPNLKSLMDNFFDT